MHKDKTKKVFLFAMILPLLAVLALYLWGPFRESPQALRKDFAASPSPERMLPLDEPRRNGSNAGEREAIPAGKKDSQAYLKVQASSSTGEAVVQAKVQVFFHSEKSMKALSRLSPQERSYMEGVPHRFLDRFGQVAYTNAKGIALFSLKGFSSGRPLSCLIGVTWRDRSLCERVMDVWAKKGLVSLVLKGNRRLSFLAQPLGKKKGTPLPGEVPIAILWKKKASKRGNGEPANQRTRIGWTNSKGELSFLDRSFVTRWIQDLGESLEVKVMGDFPGGSLSWVSVNLRTVGQGSAPSRILVPIAPTLPLSCKVVGAKGSPFSISGTFELKGARKEVGFWRVPCKEGVGSFPMVRAGWDSQARFLGSQFEIEKPVHMPPRPEGFGSKGRGKPASSPEILFRPPGGFLLRFQYPDGLPFGFQEVELNSRRTPFPPWMRGPKRTSTRGELFLPVSSLKKELHLWIASRDLKYYCPLTLPPKAEDQRGFKEILVPMRRRRQRLVLQLKDAEGKLISDGWVFVAGSPSVLAAWAMKKSEEGFLLFGPPHGKLPLLFFRANGYLPKSLTPVENKGITSVVLEKAGSYSCLIQFESAPPRGILAALLKSNEGKPSQRPKVMQWSKGWGRSQVRLQWEGFPPGNYELWLLSTKPPFLFDRFSLEPGFFRGKHGKFFCRKGTQVWKVAFRRRKKDVQASGLLFVQPDGFLSSAVHCVRVRSGDSVLLPPMVEGLFVLHPKWGLASGSLEPSRHRVRFSFPAFQAMRFRVKDPGDPKKEALQGELFPHSLDWPLKKEFKIWKYREPGVYSEGKRMGEMFSLQPFPLSKAWVPPFPGFYSFDLRVSANALGRGARQKKWPLRPKVQAVPFSSGGEITKTLEAK